MGYPKLVIDLAKIRANVRNVLDHAEKYGVEIMGVTKGVCASLPVVEAFIAGGLKKIGDSRLRNLAALRSDGFLGSLYMIRLPMMSEAEAVVSLADGSFNSEIEVIRRLSEQAAAQGKYHKVILMVDVGDLREGLMPQEVLPAVEQIIAMPNIELEGLGTNQGCYGGTIPSLESMQVLSKLSADIDCAYGIRPRILSGGGTSAICLLGDDFHSLGINQLRIGEGILLGEDVTHAGIVDGAERNTMHLLAEVIEVQIKPSLPQGEIGRDAFGNRPVFTDKGLMRRAIVALGLQDCRIENLKPKDSNIEILGASSDHLILDVTKTPKISVGSLVEFQLSYGAMLGLITSPYVEKVYLK